jgi:hypothetical protein
MQTHILFAATRPRQTHPIDYTEYHLPTMAGMGTVLRPSTTGKEVPNPLGPLRE